MYALKKKFKKCIFFIEKNFKYIYIYIVLKKNVLID